MRKLFFVLFALLWWMGTLYAQDEESQLLDPTMCWERKFASYGPDGSRTYTYYTVEGEMSQNNLSYHQLYTCSKKDVEKEYQGGFREADGKVYFLRANSDEEIVLYDFTLSVGDTIHWKGINGWNEETYILQAITPVEYGGRQRLEYSFAQSYGDAVSVDLDKWVTGVGSLGGPLHPFYTSGIESDACWCEETLVRFSWEGSVYSAAFHSNELTIDELCNQCQILSTDEVAMEKVGIRFFPNPMQETAILSFDPSVFHQPVISIYDINGKLMFEQHQFNSASIVLEKTHFPKGMYLYKVVSDNGQAEVAKFWVE